MACLKRHGYLVIHDDSNAVQGQSLGHFMLRLSRAKLVIVILSRAYLRSQYCVYELVATYARDRFPLRVIPIVLDSDLVHSEKDRAQCVRYWETWGEELDRALRNRRGVGTVRQSLAGMYSARSSALIGDIGAALSVIGDQIAIPPQQAEKDDFELLRAEIQTRIEKLSGA